MLTRRVAPLLALLLGVAIVILVREGLRSRVDLEAVAALDWASRIVALPGEGQLQEGIRIDHLDRRAPIVLRGAGGCAVADIGDLRLVRPGEPPEGPQRCEGILISTTRSPADFRGTARRSLGAGRHRLAVVERRGATEMRWGELELRVRDGILFVAGREIPFGAGRRLVIFDEAGRLSAIRSP